MTHNRQSNGDDEIDHLSFLLTKKELELSALLEITKSINSNLSESSLYRIYHFTMLGNINIPRLALFVLDNEWTCKICYGSSFSTLNLSHDPSINNILDTIYLKESPNCSYYPEFEILIPISHKNKMLSYVLIGGLLDQKNQQNNQLVFVKTITSILTVAIENKKLARKQLQQEAMRKEMEIAKEVQSMLFPKQLPNNQKIHIQASYLPNLSIGGDYYDYLSLDQDSFMLCIADVSGKGVPAALLMSNFQAALRILIRQTNDLVKIVQELNHSIINNAKGERFVTFFIAIVNTRFNTISYINAGHNPPFIVNPFSEIQLLEKGCTVLGAFANIPNIEQGVISYYPDSLLFLYTDGLTETYNDSFEEFGMEGIRDFLLNQENKNPESSHISLNETLIKFKGEQNFPDDITFMTCYLK